MHHDHPHFGCQGQPVLRGLAIPAGSRWSPPRLAGPTPTASAGPVQTRGEPAHNDDSCWRRPRSDCWACCPPAALCEAILAVACHMHGATQQPWVVPITLESRNYDSFTPGALLPECQLPMQHAMHHTLPGFCPLLSRPAVDSSSACELAACACTALGEADSAAIKRCTAVWGGWPSAAPARGRCSMPVLGRRVPDGRSPAGEAFSSSCRLQQGEHHCSALLMPRCPCIGASQSPGSLLDGQCITVAAQCSCIRDARCICHHGIIC